MFEIAARNVIDPETATGTRFSWGIPATKERVESHFTVRLEPPDAGNESSLSNRTTTRESEKHWPEPQKASGRNSPPSQVLD
jgi:hypothetical protein